MKTSIVLIRSLSLCHYNALFLSTNLCINLGCNKKNLVCSFKVWLTCLQLFQTAILTVSTVKSDPFQISEHFLLIMILSLTKLILVYFRCDNIFNFNSFKKESKCNHPLISLCNQFFVTRLLNMVNIYTIA
jgi:hypothetical protein